jgi:UDP-N-acetylglucosamine 2-epimerase (non-hydrolysing)
MKIDVIAGARPNFMKIAPILEAIEKAKAEGINITYRLIHTGQHYDHNMSEQFFEQLQIPRPHVNLGVGGGTQAQQTAGIMMAYEDLLLKESTDFCLVVGDVTSTMACTLAAAKLNVLVGHVEAGIRSGDRSMPEEINRIVTDAIANYYFTTTQGAGENLMREGAKNEQICFVGNTMIDTLLKHKSRFYAPRCFDGHEAEVKNYVVVTLHRPANVDDPAQLKELLSQIMQGANGRSVFFPVHPRTQKVLEETKFSHPHLITTSPLSYLEFNYLVANCALVVTDSGGITEETTVMQIPCITLRNNTERPETCTIGTNELIGTNPTAIVPAMERVWKGGWKKGSIPELWDGKTSERIVQFLLSLANIP